MDGYYADLEVFYNKKRVGFIHTPVDIVSKNGNLLLSIPVMDGGTINSDDDSNKSA